MPVEAVRLRKVLLRVAVAALTTSTLPVFLGLGELEGQTPVEINRAPQCGECRIETSLLTRLTGSDEAFLGFTHNVTALGDSYLVALNEVPYQLSLFSESGRFVRSVGRRGQGPGEFERIVSISAGPGDSVWVFDRRNARATVLDPNLEFAREVPVLVQLSEAGAIALKDGGFMVAGGTPLARRNELAHRYSAAGDLDWSARALPDGESAPAGLPYRWFAEAPDGSVWISHYDRYRLEKYSAAGELREVLTSDPAWFVRRVPPGDVHGHDTVPESEAHILGVSLDNRGRIWIIAETPRAGWVATRENYGDWRGVDTVIEVIDPEERRVITNARFPLAVRGWASTGVAFVYRESSDGEPFLDLISISLALPDASTSPPN